MSGRYTLENYEDIKGREVFFDANIILYIYWTTGNRSWMRQYSTLFNKLLKQGNKMYVNYLVISEVVNRAIRIEHEKYQKSQSKAIRYKDYRNSDAGVEALEDIYTILEHDVLKHFDVVSDGYDKLDIESFLIVDNLDFGDKAIEKTCIDRDMVLITNDADFKNSKLDILSVNSKLIS